MVRCAAQKVMASEISTNTRNMEMAFMFRCDMSAGSVNMSWSAVPTSAVVVRERLDAAGTVAQGVDVFAEHEIQAR